MKRRAFLQAFAAALISCAPWLRNQPGISPGPSADPAIAAVPLRPMVSVKLPGGWTYDTMTMDGPEVFADWMSTEGISRFGEYPSAKGV